MTKPSLPDTFLSDYVPPHAVICWLDDEYVYTALPVLNSPPLVQRYPLTEAGLSKALSILRVQRRNLGKTAAPKVSKPVVKYAKHQPLDEQKKQEALAVLRKLGLVPNA